ncbi:MAG: tetratricopeptide repeat protein [Microcoleaceae cyanobacterium MO_207.B10]|nr:tetratricopeptide repeat protein [Microcoleaceae cyanobacterium MO_207.B10]
MSSKFAERLKLAEEKAHQGLLFQKQGKLEAAISLYREALAIVPNLQFIDYNLGIIFHHQGDLSTAYTHYYQAIALKPDHIQAHYNLGVILQQQGLLELAISSYQKVINLSQTSSTNIGIQVQAYSNWGSILVNEDRFNEAIEIFQQAIALKPDDATLYNNLGQAYLEAGKVEKAIINYRRALAVEPNLIVARHNIGKSFQKQGLHSEAIAHFQEVIQQRPENIYVSSDCAFSFLELGKLAAAIPYLQKVISNNPFIEAYCKRVDSLTESDELEKAKIACIKFVQSLQNFTPNNKSALAEVRNNLTSTYLSLGDVYFEYGDYSQAENYYQKALQYQPLNVEIYLKLGNSLAKQKRFRTAIIIYRMGLTVKPGFYSLSQALEIVLEIILEKQNNFSANVNANGIKSILNLDLDLDLDLDLEVEAKSLSLSQNKCQGLNCEPCLKQIFKQLQPIHIGDGIHTFSTLEIETRYSTQKSTEISQIELQETPKFLTKLPKGRAWIVPQKNDWMICNAIAILDENNQLIAEVSREYPGQLPGCQKYDINTHRIFSTEKLPPLEQINGTVAVLSGLSGNIYFHWMVDILPRIEILKRNGINFEQIDFFLINSIQQPFQKETIRILGIPEDKIIESDRHPHIQAQTLIVPSFSSYLGWLPGWALEFHRRAFLNQSISPLFQDINKYPEKIYISRNKAKYRQVINEAAVINLLTKNGFITVELENLSVGEQIGLFANAKVIVSPHGSSLTNIIFCNPETTIIELVSPNYIRHYYWVISQQLRLNYYYLKGEETSYYPIRQLMYPNPLTEDILINLSSLEKILVNSSIINKNIKQKLDFPGGEKLSNSVNAPVLPQKHEKYNIYRTAISNTMQSQVNPAQEAANFHEKALYYIEQKNFDRAKAVCEQALKNQPDLAPACKTMGIILQQQGQIEAASEWYLRAINIQPDFAEAYVNIGTIYAKKQQWQEAINYYQKAIAIKPDIGPALRNLAKAYQKLGKVAEAAHFQYQAYSLEPSKITATEYINLGNTLLQQEQLTEAISCYRNALKLNPKSVVVYQNLAAALSKKGDFEEANTYYQKAIQMGVTNLSNINSNINHNLVKKSLNISENKKISYQNGLGNNKYEIEAQQKVEILEKNISKTTQQQLIKQNNHHQTITLQQDAVEAYNRLAQMLQKQGQAAEAWQWYKKALSIAPNNPEIYKNLGNLYGQQHQWEEAIKCYQKAQQIQPNSPDIYRDLATAFSHIGKQAEAAEYWEQAYSLEPETATAEEHLILGNTLLQMNLVERAISCYCNAIKINPNLTAAYQNLGEALKLNSDAKPSHLEAATQIKNSKLKPIKTDKLNGLKPNNHLENHAELHSQLATKTNVFQTSLKQFDRVFKQLAGKVATTFKPNTDDSEQSDELSLQLPKTQGENNHFQPQKKSYPAKQDLQIQSRGENYIEETLFKEEPSLKNTSWNWQEKEFSNNINQELELTTESLLEEPELVVSEINKIQKLSPTEEIEEIEDNQKIDGLKNTQPIDTAKQTTDLQSSIPIAQPDVYIQRATTYSQQGLYQQAIAECQQAIAVKPDMAVAYKILANIQQKIGSASQRQEAKQNYLKAISLDSQDASIHANLGSLYAQDESWEQAIPCYQQAIALKPDFAGAYRNLAKAWTQVDRQAEAADCWYQAYTLEPQNITPEQHLNLGNSLSRQGQLTKAISCYQRAIKLNPNYSAAYHNLAATLKRQGKLHEAAIYEQKTKEMSSGVLESANTVDKQVEVNGHKPQNINHINSEDVLHPSPDTSSDKQDKEKLPQLNQANLIKQAKAEIINGKFSEAIATCEQAISIQPHAVAYQIIGQAAAELHQIDKAVAAYQKALEIKPDFAEIYVSLGELYVQQQQQEKAIASYQKAIDLAPDLKDAYGGLVQVWLQLGKVDEAEELSYRALIEHPSWATPEEFCTLGRGLVAEGKTEQGITCFRQAIKQDPQLWSAYHSLAEIYNNQQQWDEAIKHYRQTIELNPESIESYYGLGQTLAEKSEWQEAISCYQKVIELEANQTQTNSPETEENINNIDIPEVYHLLGDALQEIGQLDKSVEAYHRAIELTENSPE